MEGPGLIVPGVRAQRRWKTGRYYGIATSLPTSATSTGAMTANRLYSLPLFVPESRAVDRIGISVSIAAAAGKKLRFGIRTEGTDGGPDALILDAGEVLADATGDREVTIAQTLPSGWCFLDVISDGTPTVRVATGVLGSSAGMSAYSAGTLRNSYYLDTTYGALPASFGAPTNDDTASHPLVLVRAA